MTDRTRDKEVCSLRECVCVDKNSQRPFMPLYLYINLMFSGTWGHLPDQNFMNKCNGQTGRWNYFSRLTRTHNWHTALQAECRARAAQNIRNRRYYDSSLDYTVFL